MDEARSGEVGYAWIPPENINSKYLPDYHSLSLRIDRRFFFRKSNLVVFAGALNVYNRQNEVERDWNPEINDYDIYYMWGIVPYLGLRFEF